MFRVQSFSGVERRKTGVYKAFLFFENENRPSIETTAPVKPTDVIEVHRRNMPRFVVHRKTAKTHAKCVLYPTENDVWGNNLNESIGRAVSVSHVEAGPQPVIDTSYRGKSQVSNASREIDGELRN